MVDIDGVSGGETRRPTSQLTIEAVGFLLGFAVMRPRSMEMEPSTPDAVAVAEETGGR